jgi:histidine decarboxylase
MPTKDQRTTPRRRRSATAERERRWRTTGDNHSAIAALVGRIEEARPTLIGFPAATDFVDFTLLTHLLGGQLLNNVGDPWQDGIYPNHTKDMERDVVAILADLLRAPADDRWGYVTTGATEGNLYALYLARQLHPDAIVYHSSAAHYSLPKAVHLLGMQSVVVRADDSGEIDYSDLADQARRHRDRPAVIVANVGTTMTEAVDDVHRISTVLDACGIQNRYIHADAALAGIPLALLDPAARPGFDFADGADSVIVSGHKFVGVPFACGVVVVRRSLRSAAAERNVAYIGGHDATITGSRNGHAPVLLWYALDRHGTDGLRRRAEAARELAAYTQTQLARLGWESFRNPYAMTVALKTPPAAVTDHWALPSEEGWSHIVCMPGLRRSQIDRFIQELGDALRPPDTGTVLDLPRRVAHDPKRPAIPTTGLTP